MTGRPISPWRCIRPQCPPDCSGCNHAIPSDDEALLLIADMLDHFAVDGHGGTFEDGESAMTDRARAFLCRPRIGLTHNLPPELRPTARGIAPQARATGYVAPGLLAVVVRVVRRLIGG